MGLRCIRNHRIRLSVVNRYMVCCKCAAGYGWRRYQRAERTGMRERFHQFMQGRYGTDQFSGFMAWTALILWVIAKVTKYFILEKVCLFTAIAMVLYFNYRILSRNHAKRYRENERFLIMTGRVRRYMQKWQHQIQMRRDHRIFQCPSCSQKIRVPKGKGKIAITCPQCRTEFIRRT